ncbi:MAG TPA: methyltransferase, partial [Beijerinckiaceae bacterium]
MTNDPALGAPQERLFAGRVRLRQTVSGHRVGTDAVLLAACLTRPGPLAVDAGAGVGAVGLTVAARSAGTQVALVERDGEAAALAAANVVDNGLSDRARVAACDLLAASARRAAGLGNGAASAVFTNPPFYEAARVRASPDAARAAAHVLGAEGLAGWLRACLALLAPDGAFALIHRPEALADILAACEGRAGGLRLLGVHPRAGA